MKILIINLEGIKMKKMKFLVPAVIGFTVLVTGCAQGETKAESKQETKQERRKKRRKNNKHKLRN